MSVMIAHRTLRRIAEGLEKDQGAAYRGFLRELMPLAEDAYRTDSDPFRSHLGASLVGKECERALWYTFHWVRKAFFDARILRLFNRGHLEEPRLLALLRMIGCEVWHHTEDGSQFRISGHNGHFGGSLDCVISGVEEDWAPDYTGHPALGEFKTHSLKSFTKLAGSLEDWEKNQSDPAKYPFRGEGVRKTKFDHYVQMQLYMGKKELHWALYLAVCKDNDSVYAEIVFFDPAVYQAFDQRAGNIIRAKAAPPRIHKDPTWYACKFCDLNKICHSGAPPERNCRTCENASPATDGLWECSLHSMLLNPAAQLLGCSSYALSSKLK